MDPQIAKFFGQYVPRWVKVIKWPEFWNRHFGSSPMSLYLCMAIPIGLHLLIPSPDKAAIAIWFQQPATEEECNKVKRNYYLGYSSPMAGFVGRNWEFEKYDGQFPPLYDVWERRKQYPEYYGERYNIKAGDAFSNSYQQPMGTFPKWNH